MMMQLSSLKRKIVHFQPENMKSCIKIFKNFVSDKVSLVTTVAFYLKKSQLYFFLPLQHQWQDRGRLKLVYINSMSVIALNRFSVGSVLNTEQKLL